MAITFTLTADGFYPEGTRYVQLGTMAFDSSYPTGGEAITAANVGLSTIDRLEIENGSASGYRFEWDSTNSNIKVYWDNAAVTHTINVGDDDTAATNGVAIYAHLDDVVEQGMQIGHLEFVSPTNADGITAVNTGTGVPNLYLQDDDGATNSGTVIYLDEDGTSGSRFLFVSPSDRDLYIPLSDGSFMKIADDDTAATNGVQVYFDEDGTDGSARMLFVSPTNTDGTDTTAIEQHWRSGEVANGFDLSGLTGVRFKAIGT